MKLIIITGANSGIGFECALQIARMATTEQIILACRNSKSGNQAMEKIKIQTGYKNLIYLPLDLASLQSIKEFKEIIASEPNNQIIALINNAGLQIVKETRYTVDGFEETFGVNHLGPFYLTMILLPFLSDDARITFTASGTHDPKQKTGMPSPEFKDPKELAHPKENSEKLLTLGQRRYTTSKLCNIMTVYQLQEHLSNTNIHVNAFDPGFVPGTGLAKNYPPFLKFISDNIFPILTLFVHNVNTAKNSGKRLANLAYGEQYKDAKGKYFEGAKEIRSSIDSYNKEYQGMLWRSSIDLLELKEIENYMVQK